MVATREVQCGACGAVNRVPGYSVRRIPECGKCHARLPEPAATTAVRRLYVRRIPLAVIAVIAVSAVVVAGYWYGVLGTRAMPAACAARPKPNDGLVRFYSDTAATLTRLTISAGSGADFFVKLVDAATDRDIGAYFVTGGSTVRAYAPAGSFIVKQASGSIWCGDQDLFGPQTAFEKGTRPVTLGDDGTSTLMLSRPPNQQFPTAQISRAEF
jgi:hypothetical protein